MPDESRKAYSVAEAAGLLGLSRSAVYSLCEHGKLRCLRSGQKIVIPKDAVDEFLGGGGVSSSVLRDAVADGIVLGFRRLLREFTPATPDSEELPLKRRSKLRAIDV